MQTHLSDFFSLLIWRKWSNMVGIETPNFDTNSRVVLDVITITITFSSSLFTTVVVHFQDWNPQNEILQTQDYVMARFIARREALPPLQILVKLVFGVSSRLVVAPTTVLNIWQRLGLGERSGLPINESCNRRVLTICLNIVCFSLTKDLNYPHILSGKIYHRLWEKCQVKYCRAP